MRLMRACEGVIPPGCLRLAVLPTALLPALIGGRLRAQLKAGWRVLGLPAPGITQWFREAVRFHLARYLNFWPDRLSQPRWQRRLRFRGLEPVHELQDGHKPVVLVCLHHGPIHILRYLLRSAGVCCAMVVLEARTERSPVREWKDRLSPPGDVPNVFCRDELKEMKRFMKNGGCLLVAADYGRGKMCKVPFGPAEVRIASGAFRLAESVGATVFPVAITETKGWCYDVEIYPGVAATDGAEGLPEKVLAPLAAKILATPELMHSQLADSLTPAGESRGGESEF